MRVYRVTYRAADGDRRYRFHAERAEAEADATERGGAFDAIEFAPRRRDLVKLFNDIAIHSEPSGWRR